MISPSEVLGIAAAAGEEEIRAAYLSKVREFPPDRAPEEFEKIRDAYDALRDPRKRARAMLVTREFAAPMASLADGLRARRIYAGPQAWRDVLKSK